MRGKKVIFIVLLLSVISFGQQWERYENWNEFDCVALQGDSIVWGGTKTGLVKFDVKKLTRDVYGIEEGMPSSAVNDLEFDNEGNLWIATEGGLVKYDGSLFRLYDSPGYDLPSNNILSIAIDKNNIIYAGVGAYIEDNTYNFGGIAFFENEKWTLFGGSEYNFISQCRAITVYRDTVYATMEVRDLGTIMYRIVDGRFEQDETWRYPTAMQSYTIDHEGNLWAAGGRTLYIRENGAWTEVIGIRAKLGSIFGKAWSDGSNGLWLGGMRNSLYYLDIPKYRNGEIDYYPIPGLQRIGYFEDAGWLNDLATNDSDKYFLATDGGIYLLDREGNRKMIYKKNGPLASNNIYGLGCSMVNEVLVSDGVKVNRFEDGAWTTLEGLYGTATDFVYTPEGRLITDKNPPLKGEFYNGIDVDQKGNFWAAYGYINAYLYRDYKMYEITPSDIGFEIVGNRYPMFLDVTVDKYDRVWGASRDGNVLAMKDPSGWTLFDNKDAEAYYSLTQDFAFGDSRGRVWFGTKSVSPNNGIVLYDHGKWETFSFSDTWFGQHLYDMAEDHFGNLFFATSVGLLQLDNNNNWHKLNRNNSFLDVDRLSALTVDRRGNIWVGSPYGLYVYNPEGIDHSTDVSLIPGVDLALEKRGERVVVSFAPGEVSGRLKFYELQRGRRKHKFWSVARLEASKPADSRLALTDTTEIIGDYLYRIKGVDFAGRAYYSEYIKYKGEKKDVEVEEFYAEKKEGNLYLNWKTSSEKFVEYFKISVNDNDNEKNIAFIQPSGSETGGFYSVVAGKLGRDTTKKTFILSTVFSDSSLVTLKHDYSLGLPEEFYVTPNYPNPFNGSTTFGINVPGRQRISLKIYDILGNLVINHVDKIYQGGFYEETVEFSGLSSGVYVYVVQGRRSQRYTGKMVYLK